MNDRQAAVTRLIEELKSGDRGAADELFALLYKELKEIAGRQRQRWHGNYTFNTTALVHEAYLKLVDQAQLGTESGAHFRALTARAMRHILCDYARKRSAKKRGGGREKLPLDELKVPPVEFDFSEEQSAVLRALDDALERLERLDPRQSRVVECRFFGGLTVEETATAIGFPRGRSSGTGPWRRHGSAVR